MVGLATLEHGDLSAERRALDRVLDRERNDPFPRRFSRYSEGESSGVSWQCVFPSSTVELAPNLGPRSPIFSAIFDQIWQNFDFGAMEKGANLVHFENVAKMNIWSHKSASIELRMGPDKFAG